MIRNWSEYALPKWWRDEQRTMGAVGIHAYRLNLDDGRLAVIVAKEPKGWHLSISHADHHGEPDRYPTWDEIADARYDLLPNDVTVAMLLPPREQYVNLHDTTFHLHQIDDDDEPEPGGGQSRTRASGLIIP